MADPGDAMHGLLSPEAGVIVQAAGLSRKFGSFTAVDTVSLRIGAGAIFGLIGPNGAGKSTLVKMLTTMLPPSSGQALVAGFDIVKSPSRVRQHIGYVPQQLSADGELTGYENLLLSARLYAIPRNRRSAVIDQALAMMGLGAVRDRLVRNYSGGMIRRLEIAQSTLHRPRVVFMDEPTVGLDPAGRHVVWDHVRGLRRELGAAIVLTTHYMDEAEELCDQIAVMRDGRIEALGSPTELRERLGPTATLDDVFQSLAGTGMDSGGLYRDVREVRRSISGHG